MQPIAGVTSLTSSAKTVPLVVTSGGSLNVSAVVSTITPHFAAPAASSTTVIPIGAIGASVIILTGTGTLNAVDQPVGIPWTEPGKLAATVTLVLASASTARVYYGT